MPVSGYYEWYYENSDDKEEKPQPYYFKRRDGGLMTTAITGLRGRDNLVLHAVFTRYPLTCTNRGYGSTAF